MTIPKFDPCPSWTYVAPPQTWARIGIACRLRVKDFHQDGEEATVTLHEKGDKHRRIGLHFAAAEAIAAYITKAEITKGPLFRPAQLAE